MSRFAQRVMRGNQTSASGGGGLRTITHGDQLLVSDVGPWALQGVAKGSEILSTISSGGERIKHVAHRRKTLMDTEHPLCIQ